jgi:predicted O-methyltransferase YrrM
MTFSIATAVAACHEDNVTLQGKIPDVLIEGGTGPDKRLLMFSLIYALDAKLIYEVGINQGGGASMLCRACENSGAKYVGFDIKKELSPVVDELRLMYPSVSVEVEWGDSIKTVPDRLQRTGEKPDFFFVDGGHSKEQLIADLNNALSCVRKGGIIFVDDSIPLKPHICSVIPEKEWVWFIDNPGRNGPGSCFYQVK